MKLASEAKAKTKAEKRNIETSLVQVGKVLELEAYDSTGARRWKRK